MGAVTLQMQDARSLSMFCFSIPAVLPVSYGSQLPLLVAVAVHGGLDEVC